MKTTAVILLNLYRTLLFSVPVPENCVSCVSYNYIQTEETKYTEKV